MNHAPGTFAFGLEPSGVSDDLERARECQFCEADWRLNHMARNWEAGNVIMGRYRLVSLLGQGGMGSVWRAEHTELKTEVAVKLLDAAIAGNEEMIARFLREARAAASLKNRHVIQIFDHGIEDGDAFMVMELLHGETLGERISRKGKLSVEETVTFMTQVMRAMGKAHDSGIIHRDLKPDNIFITSDDEGEYAKVLDFGVAKVAADLGATNGVKTQTGMMLGTPFYMSPEQAKAKNVDPRTDVWALAVITYECLTGRRPFSGDSFADLVLSLVNAPIPIPSRVAPVPMGFDEWFVHATQRDVDRRFRSARDMANELVQLADAPLTTSGGSTYGHATGPMRTPGRGTPAPGGSRMSLTTGQNAAVGVDAGRRVIPVSGGGIPWLWVAAGALVSAGVGGFIALRSSPDEAAADALVATQSADERPLTEDEPLPRDESDAAEKPGTEDTDSESSDASESAPSPKEDAPRAEATEQSPAPSRTPAATTTPAPSPSPAPTVRRTESPEPAPASRPAPSSGNVPVVDSQALPPTEWEF